MTTGFGSEQTLELIELFLKGQITENKIFKISYKSTKSYKNFTLENFSLQVYRSGNVNTNVTASSGEAL